MNIFLPYFQSILEFSNSSTLFIILQTISLTALSTLLINLFKKTDNIPTITTSLSTLIFFLIPTIAILAENVSNIARFAFPGSWIKVAFSCLAWTTGCFKFHSFLLFIEKLINKNAPVKPYHYIFFFIESVLCVMVSTDKIYRHIHNAGPGQFSLLLYQAIVMFWVLSILPSIITILKKLSGSEVPFLINKQLKTLLYYFLLPQLVSIFIEFTPLFFSGTPTHITAFENLSLILMTASIYFCFNRIMQFRFLNLSSQVQTKRHIPASSSFKEALEYINIASTNQELTYITQQFFVEQIDINKSEVTLYIRSSEQAQDRKQQLIECFLSNNSTENVECIDALCNGKILVSHELEFDEYYSNKTSIVTLASFLRSIECDVFLPIISNKKILGYITIQRQKTNVLYNDDQQNKMIVFAQFLAPAIHLMLQQNLYVQLQDTKITKEALHEKTQEINQYKESIKQLLKDRVEHHIGIIFFKNKHFAFKNQEAHKLLGLNPNLETDHPTTATLINFAQQVEKYQTTQTMYITVSNGTKLILTGMPHAEVLSGTLLIVRKPEATDLIKMHIDALKDPSERDYLLYLETTKAGQIINKLLPSAYEMFLQTKVILLQAVLQKSVLLIECNNTDINPIIDIIHSLGEQQGLCTIDLKEDHNGGVKLFGINPLMTQTTDQALLERYHQGTIVLQNIEHLDSLSQQKLVQFIKYGIFTPLKSEQRKLSDTRIICSTNYNMASLVQEGKIIPELYEELKKRCITIPSLVTMNHEYLSCIIDEYMYHNLQEHGPKTVVALSQKEKDVLITKRIASLFELKQKVLASMMLKAQDKLSLGDEQTTTNRFIDTASPELQLAAQLGKHALKDVQLMKHLWKKLGSQTKIADLLGVNRSSVSRRCKDYHLL